MNVLVLWYSSVFCWIPHMLGTLRISAKRGTIIYSRIVVLICVRDDEHLGFEVCASPYQCSKCIPPLIVILLQLYCKRDKYCMFLWRNGLRIKHLWWMMCACSMQERMNDARTCIWWRLATAWHFVWCNCLGCWIAALMVKLPHLGYAQKPSASLTRRWGFQPWYYHGRHGVFLMEDRSHGCKSMQIHTNEVDIVASVVFVLDLRGAWSSVVVTAAVLGPIISCVWASTLFVTRGEINLIFAWSVGVKHGRGIRLQPL